MKDKGIQHSLELVKKSSKAKWIECHFKINLNLPTVLRRSYCILKSIPDFRYHKAYTESNKVINKFHNIHQGERVFIIGMGPSLNKTNFQLIKDEHMIALNGFFTGIEKFNVNPDYWCVSDMCVFDDIYKSLFKLDTNLFLMEDAGRAYLKKNLSFERTLENNPIVVKPLGDTSTWNQFSKDLSKGATGGNVMFGGLQLAYYLGFDETYLIGCDCEGLHFDDTADEETSIPGFGRAFEHYEMFKREFEKDNCKIYNSTVGGALEVFERKSLEDL